MKIQEIIAEENIVSRGIKAAARPFVNAAVGATDYLLKDRNARKAALDKVAAQWAHEINTAGKATTPAGSILSKAEQAFARDKKFLDDAAKTATKAVDDAKYARNLEKLKTGFDSSTELAINGAKLLGWSAILYDNGKHIYELNKKLSNGEIDQAEYDQELRYWMGKMVTQMVAAKMVGGLFNKSGQIVSTVPFMGKLGEKISSLSPAAKAAFVAWIANPMDYPAGGKEAFANWYAGTTFLPEVAKASQKWLGGLALNSWRQIEEWAGVDIPTGASQFGGPKGAEKEPESDLTPPMGTGPDAMEFDSATGKWLNRPGV